jgi:hypothetical protein
MERALDLDANERTRIGELGRRYVLDRYSEAHVQQRLIEAVERVVAAAAA